MQVSEIQWSVQEREIAKAALETARRRETATLVKVVRDNTGEIDNIDDIWRLHDFLSARRYDIEGKYDDKESELLFVLSKLVKEGWLALNDLTELESSKLTKITALTRVL